MPRSFLLFSTNVFLVLQSLRKSTLIHYSLSVFGMGVASRRSDISGFDRNARRDDAQCRASSKISAKATGSAIHCRSLHKKQNRG
jgi:hypothetical protein